MRQAKWMTQDSKDWTVRTMTNYINDQYPTHPSRYDDLVRHADLHYASEEQQAKFRKAFNKYYEID